MATKHSSRGAGSKKSYKRDAFEGETDETTYYVEEEKSSFNVRTPFKHNPKQKLIIEKMLHDDTKILILDGLWGTSKSYCAVYSALKLLARGTIDKIYYIRTPCESSNTAKIGTLPGSLQERLAGYNAVMEEKLVEFIPFNIATKLIKDTVVEYLPPGLIRGRNLTNAVLICDEASNFSWEDILLICSRLGQNSRLYMVGDSFQNDIGKKSGFKRFYDVMNDEQSVEKGVHCYQMRDKSDIVRSGIIRYIMEKVGVI